LSLFRKIRTTVFQIAARFLRPMTLGARIVVFDDQGRICLIRHTYTPGWHLPGGGVERGESCLAAAAKEVCEEVGLLIPAQDLKLASIHSNFSNMPGDHVTIFHAKPGTQMWPSVPTNNAHEIAECGWFAPDALPEGTTLGTRSRVAEALGAPVKETW
jgi:8-oxo-dGTP pyrophosphatase MutT (NUDIX family)